MPRKLIAALSFVAGLAALASAQNVSLSVDASINGGNPPVAGTTATYTITVSNEGPANALNVLLSTSVPAGTTLNSFSFPGSWSCAVPSSGGTGSITCSNPAFAPGSDVFMFVVNVPRATAQGTPITLTANVTTTSPDPDPNDNSVTLTALVVWQSLLTISKTVPPSAVAGAPITYTLNVTNAGPSDAADVMLNDVLPAAVLFDSVTAPGWTCTTPPLNSSGTVSCSIVQFGTSGTVTVQAHTAPSAPAQTLTNNADISASSEPNTHIASATTTLTQSADVSVTKSSTALVAGTDVTYTIVVTNAGPSDAANLALSDTLPPPLTFQSISAPGWSCIVSNCTRATLAPGSSTITLVAHIPPSTPPGTTIDNTANVTSSTFDPTTPNSSTSSGTVTAQSDLAVTIGDAPDPVTVGGPPLIYTIVVTNNGPSDAPNPSMSVALPPSVTFASVNAPPGWICSGTVSCTTASLAVSATATFTVNVNVTSTTPGGATITTTASVASAATDPNAGNSSAPATTSVLAPASVSATKQATGPFFETLAFTYTITLTNAGPGTQGDNPGDEMTDQLPSSVTLLGASASAGTATADIANNRVLWNGSIPAGGSVTITIQARVNSGTAGTPISNQASIAYDADGNGTNEATGVSNAAVFTPFAAGQIPAMSEIALIALALMLAALALRK